MDFIRSDLADLNKKAGVTSLPPRHYDCKRGNTYDDKMYRHVRHSWSKKKDTCTTQCSCVILSSDVDVLAKQN